MKFLIEFCGLGFRVLKLFVILFLWKLNEARVAFTRTDDLNLIRKHNNLPIEESDEGTDFDTWYNTVYLLSVATIVVMTLCWNDEKEDDENLANQNYSATEPVMSVPIQI